MATRLAIEQNISYVFQEFYIWRKWSKFLSMLSSFFLSVTMFRWRDANSIAINFSKVTNFRWKHEAVQSRDMKLKWNFQLFHWYYELIIGISSTGYMMVGQEDQSMHQSPLNRPTRCCCWFGVEVLFTRPLSPAR